jgi:hypothetical protein
VPVIVFCCAKRTLAKRKKTAAIISRMKGDFASIIVSFLSEDYYKNVKISNGKYSFL